MPVASLAVELVVLNGLGRFEEDYNLKLEGANVCCQMRCSIPVADENQ